MSGEETDLAQALTGFCHQRGRGQPVVLKVDVPGDILAAGLDVGEGTAPVSG
jgi:hypothetical protein